MLQACTVKSEDEPATKKSETNISEDQGDKKTSESNEDKKQEGEENQMADIQRIGQTNYGFVDIPANWVRFQDIDGAGTAIQYSDLLGKSIITLNAGNDSGSDAETYAKAIWAKMEDEGAENVVGAMVTLGGNSAYQVYGIYPQEAILLVTWVFDTDDGYLHYVSAEAPVENITEIVTLIEKSFSLEK